jgi:hypothetical protein
MADQLFIKATIDQKIVTGVFAARGKMLALASHRTIAELAAMIGSEGRRHIASTGIKSTAYWPWATKWYAGVIDTPKDSINARLFTRHKLNLANIFERAPFTISGGRNRRLLWIPFANSKMMTAKGSTVKPKDYQATTGHKLALIVGKSGLPELIDDVSRKPMYFGVPSVTIRRKFDLTGVIDKSVARIPAIFNKKLGNERG